MVIDQSMDVSRIMDTHKYSDRSQIKFMKHLDAYFSKDACILSLSRLTTLAYFVNGNYDAKLYYNILYFEESCANSESKNYVVGVYNDRMKSIRGVQLYQNDPMSFKFNKMMQFNDISVDVDTEDNDNIYFEFEQEGLLIYKFNYTMLKRMSKSEKEHIRFNSVEITNNGSGIASIMKFTNAKDEISKWPINVGYSINYLYRDDDHSWIVYAKEYFLGIKRHIPEGKPRVFDTHSILAGATEMKANIIINDGTSYLAEIVKTSPPHKL
jgi:hypothetical protein